MSNRAKSYAVAEFKCNLEKWKEKKKEKTQKETRDE